MKKINPQDETAPVKKKTKPAASSPKKKKVKKPEKELSEKPVPIQADPLPKRDISAPTELVLSPSQNSLPEESLLSDPKRKWTRPITFAAILLVLAIVVLVAGIFFSGVVEERVSTPLTVKGKKIAAAEFSFMYHYILRSNGVDIYQEGMNELLMEPGENEFETQREYFIDLTAKTIQKRNILYDDAIAGGYSIGDADRQMAESYVQWLQSKATEINVNIDIFISGYYGDYVTTDTIREVLSKQYFTENYESDVKLDELKATEEQAEAAYQQAPQQYDEISYRTLRIVFDSASESSVKTANIHAQEILDKIAGDETKFESVAAEYLTGTARENILKENSTLRSNIRYNQIQNATWQSWLFAAERKPGDGVIFQDENGFPILFCFSKRERQNEPYRDAYFIEIMKKSAENGESGAQGEALTLAQNIYDSITDENSINNLTNTYGDEIFYGDIVFTHDEAVFRGSYEGAVDAWLFDPARSKGDKNILENETTVLVICYMGSSPNPEWFDKVNSFIRMNNYQDFLNEKIPEYPYKLNTRALTRVIGLQ